VTEINQEKDVFIQSPVRSIVFKPTIIPSGHNLFQRGLCPL
jgi:hypothetical protein